MNGKSELRERKVKDQKSNGNYAARQKVQNNVNDKKKYNSNNIKKVKPSILSYICTFSSGNLFVVGLPFIALIYTSLDYLQLKFWLIPLAACYTLNLIILTPHLKPHNGLSLLRDSEFFRSHFDYFPMTIHTNANLNSDSQYVFGVHPHGIHCWPLSLFSCRKSSFFERFPNVKPCIGLAASILFWIPGVREVFLAMAYCDAGRSTAQKILNEGYNLYVCTGGEAESMLTEKGKDRVVLEDRKGFIRLALSYGVDIVPIYGCGVTNVYKTYSAGWTVRKWIQKNLGLALPVFHGCFFGMPYSRPISVLVGKPIKTPKPEKVGYKPDDKLVDEYHKKYMKALKDLFDEYKVKDEVVGYDESRVLEIVSSKKSLFDCLR